MNRPLPLDRLYGTTAMFHGLSWINACRELQHLGVNMGEVQLCPQTSSRANQATLAALRAEYPQTRFRFHANVCVEAEGQKPRKLWSLATRGEDAWAYYRTLAPLCVGMPFISLHAGETVGTLRELAAFLHQLQDLFPCPLGVEGMYPGSIKKWAIASWAEYQQLLALGIPYALDMSHLSIVRTFEPRVDARLVYALTHAPQCAEIHVSGNNGRSDQHTRLPPSPWWLPFLEGTTAPCFTEERWSVT